MILSIVEDHMKLLAFLFISALVLVLGSITFQIVNDDYLRETTVAKALLAGKAVSLEDYSAFTRVACGSGFEGSGLRPYFYAQAKKDGLSEEHVRRLCQEVAVSSKE